MAEELGATVGKVFLVGAGPGDPGLITVRGLRLLQQADVVIYDHLVDERLLAEVPRAAELIYVGKLASQHTLRQSEINILLVVKAQEGKRVVRLKGGDPFVFGRGGEEAQVLAGSGIPFEVVPGVTSAIAAPAYAGIPVTHRAHASSFAVITGHEDPTKPTSRLDWEKLATGVDTLICLMGAQNLTHIVAQLLRHGRAPETPIALVRWGTWPTQETLVGTLADIVELAAARQYGAPAIAIVGEVVRLRDTIQWLDNRSPVE
ncbi:MAG: uroporphyrinogen-III C-methyltransferase [Chloroflexi bacterium]|nr:uroporphyrinogen-III C-methyltransferase [Chloroflexota bacterium]